MDRKITRHNWCVLREFSEGSKIDPSLLIFHHLLFAFVLVGVLTRKRFLGLRAIFSKVWGTSAIKTTVVVLPLIELSIIWPWTRLLLLLLLRHWDSSCSLLLRWPKNPFAWCSFPRWGFGSCILHQTIPWWLCTRGSSRWLRLLPSTMCCNAVILGNGHINQLIKTIRAGKVETFPELGIKTTTETILLLGIGVYMMTRILT